MFCKKPESHKLKNYYFCSQCSISGSGEPSSKPLKEIFYCEACIPAMKSKKHGSHTSKLIALTEPLFAQKYEEFISELQQCVADIYYEEFDKAVSLK
jgi:hypothetical protein